MTARQAGFLTSRVIAVVLAVRATGTLPVALHQLQIERDPDMREWMSSAGEMLGWVYIAVIVAFLLASAVLWQKADAIAGLFAQPDDHEPASSRVNWQSLGLRLLGIYVVLDSIPGLFHAFDIIRQEREDDRFSWGGSGMFTLYGPLAVLLVGLSLAFLQGRVRTVGNYMFNYDSPPPEEKDQE